MLKTILFPLAVLLFTSAIGKNKQSIELSLIARYDQHGDYVSNFGGRAYNDTNKLYGMSYGAAISYRRKLTKTFSAYLGLGYYRLGIDKIKGSMPFNIPGTRTARNIDYDDGSTRLLYSTSEYHYNNLSLTAGLNKTAFLSSNLYLDFGAEGIAYYSLSQRYRLFNGNKYFSASNEKPWEFGANLTLGVLKEYRRFYIRPALLIPVYQNLKGDKLFYEDRNMNISKWFHGIGVSVKVGKYI